MFVGGFEFLQSWNHYSSGLECRMGVPSSLPCVDVGGVNLLSLFSLHWVPLVTT